MFENKLVAVMNEKIEPGVIMNALAHMCIGFGSDIGKEPLRLTNYIDADEGSHPHISEMPFMILKPAECGFYVYFLHHYYLLSKGRAS